MRLVIILLFSLTIFQSCTEHHKAHEPTPTPISNTEGSNLILLGTIQDGGSPHIGCKKSCCAELFENPDPSRQVVSLGLYDAQNNKRYIFEATPDFPRQVKALKGIGSPSDQENPDGIFLTHAHIGHYTGLMYLGKEATDAREVPVYAMPRMQQFLKNNGPWDQLVNRKNISLKAIAHEQSIKLSEDITVTPILVPHRDEYSETLGYKIKGEQKSALFIPDIDKWEKWDRDILDEIKSVDYAFLDATFYSGSEINMRDITQIPHPFIIESLEKFEPLSVEEREKVIFIHFNHTNPVIDRNHPAALKVLEAGYRLGQNGQVFPL